MPALLLRLKPEEAAMIEKFGDGYRDYRRKVPAIFPYKGPVRMTASREAGETSGRDRHGGGGGQLTDAGRLLEEHPPGGERGRPHDAVRRRQRAPRWSPRRSRISRRSRYMDAKAARRLDLSHRYGVAAARMAAEDGSLDFDKIDPDRIGHRRGDFRQQQRDGGEGGPGLFRARLPRGGAVCP